MASRLIDRPGELARSVCATASSAWLKTMRAASSSGLEGPAARQVWRPKVPGTTLGDPTLVLLETVGTGSAGSCDGTTARVEECCSVGGTEELHSLHWGTGGVDQHESVSFDLAQLVPIRFDRNTCGFGHG